MSSADLFPYFTQGTVVSGFQRGSTELGIPTANFPQDVVDQLPNTFDCGVYYGFASIDGFEGVHKMVLSVGKNVYYGCNVKTMETHIMHKFDKDFYGHNLKLIILGFIRPMCNFDSLDGLITAIHCDIQHACDLLESFEKLHYKDHPYLKSSTKTELASDSEENQSSAKPIKKHCQAMTEPQKSDISISKEQHSVQRNMHSLESKIVADEKVRIQI